MTVHIEAFPKSCRYGKYLSLVTVLVLKIFFLSSNFCCRNFKHWQKPKLVFLRQKKTKCTWQVSSLFEIPYIRRKLKQILALCWPQGARVCFSLFSNMSKIKQTWNSSSGKTSSKTWKYLKSHERVIKKSCAFFRCSSRQKY